MSDWLTLHQGEAPLILAFPHGGTDLAGLDADFVSPWLARRDADWWIEDLYAFARELGATTIATAISRSVIDVNRDPSGASLYPGQATTELVPTTSFDGEPLQAAGPPAPGEMERRKALYFAPYHAALSSEIIRLRALHPRLVLYDAHSIRSRIPRLFDGELPQFNIGTDGGRTCAAELEDAVAEICAASGLGHVVNGRFRGGWTTRHHGAPEKGIHAIQMELAMRGYMKEPETVSEANWPAPPASDPPIAAILRTVIATCLAFAKGQS